MNINSLLVGSEIFLEPGEIAKELNYHFGFVARKVLAEAQANTSKPEGSINPDYFCPLYPRKKNPSSSRKLHWIQLESGVGYHLINSLQGTESRVGYH